MSDSWRPRPHDHLVEPLFGGLGPEAPADPADGRRRARTSPRLLLVAVLASALALAALALAR